MEALALHDVHAARGARFGEVNGREVVGSYGDLAGELAAAKGQVGLLDASYRGAIRVTGDDRSTFLHGMCTNEVDALPASAFTYAATLTHKGAMVADFRIFKRGEELLLDLEPSFAQVALAHLNKFLISEDAELFDASSEYRLFELFGPKAAAALEGAGLPVPEKGKFLEVDGGFVLGGTAHLLPGFGVWAKSEGAPALFEKLAASVAAQGGKMIGFDAEERLRIDAGVPRFGVDLFETVLPLEANLERGISYNKGCYIGQEVVARATFRGQVNKKLTRLTFEGALPAARTELRRGEKKIGFVTSATELPGGGKVGLGYVHRDSLEAGTELEVVGAGTAKVLGLAAPQP